MNIVDTLLYILMMSLILLGYIFFNLKVSFLCLKFFLALIESQFSTKIKILQYNSGGEYMSNEFHFSSKSWDHITTFLSFYSTTKQSSWNKKSSSYRCCSNSSNWVLYSFSFLVKLCLLLFIWFINYLLPTWTMILPIFVCQVCFLRICYNLKRISLLWSTRS